MSTGSELLHMRAAKAADAAEIARIYNEGIEDRVATFETRLRDKEEVRTWFTRGLPIIVVEGPSRLVAAAWCAPFSARACYATNADFSVYVERASRGRGTGRVAMDGLLDAAERAGLTKVVSGIFVENLASRRLLTALGFREIGTYARHGRLDGAWRDVVLMERLLGAAALAEPVAPSGPGRKTKMATIRVLGIDHVVLRVRNLEAMVRFYCEALGCDVEKRRTDLGLVHLRAGRSMIDLVDVAGQLGLAGAAPPEHEGRNVDHLALRIDALDPPAVRAHLARFAVSASEETDNFGAEGDGPSVYLQDPEGNTIELKGPRRSK